MTIRKRQDHIFTGSHVFSPFNCLFAPIAGLLGYGIFREGMHSSGNRSINPKDSL